MGTSRLPVHGFFNIFFIVSRSRLDGGITVIECLWFRHLMNCWTYLRSNFIARVQIKWTCTDSVCNWARDGGYLAMQGNKSVPMPCSSYWFVVYFADWSADFWLCPRSSVLWWRTNRGCVATCCRLEMPAASWPRRGNLGPLPCVKNTPNPCRTISPLLR